jgi:1,5-anhydro-D-fructose reductase (1,5-anhydro-D-mannitol-forming)
MMRVGIVGLGFMGKMHLRCYQAIPQVQVAALCDIDTKQFQQSASAGNISGASSNTDLKSIPQFSDFDRMLKEIPLDAVSITLPTYLHADYTVKALEAGLHVLCEKPMALSEAECRRMIAAADKTGKVLQIGHCIRFWPEYAHLKELIANGQYGPVRAAMFRRLSLTPIWSSDNWLLDGDRSGGAVLDLHIHDADYIHYVFGWPKSVFSRGCIGPSRDFDHVVTQYIYDDVTVTAEGGWMMTPGFGFEMSFTVILDKASVFYHSGRQPTYTVFPLEGKPVNPPVAEGDGYSREIAYFTDRITARAPGSIITPQDSMQSVILVDYEKESLASGKAVPAS